MWSWSIAIAGTSKFELDTPPIRRKTMSEGDTCGEDSYSAYETDQISILSKNRIN